MERGVGVKFPSLVDLSLDRPKRGAGLSKDELIRWAAECIFLNDLLVANNVPLNKDCGKPARTPAGAKRTLDAADGPSVECSADGYLMRVDVRAASSLGMEEGGAAFLVRSFSGPLARAGAFGSFNWVFFDDAEKFEERLPRLRAELGMDALRCVPKGEFSLSASSDQVLRSLEDPASKSLLDTVMAADHLFVSEDRLTAVFSRAIETEDEAFENNLPWVEGKTVPYLYVFLICSQFADRSADVMRAMKALALSLGLRYLYVPAMPGAAIKYIRIANAEFVNRETDETVNVTPEALFRTPALVPMSKSEARRLLDGRGA